MAAFQKHWANERSPATFSESAELSCACPIFRRETFADPTRYVIDVFAVRTCVQWSSSSKTAVCVAGSSPAVDCRRFEGRVAWCHHDEPACMWASKIVCTAADNLSLQLLEDCKASRVPSWPSQPCLALLIGQGHFRVAVVYIRSLSQTRKSSSRTVLNPQLWPWGEQLQQREADQFVPLLKVSRLVTTDRQTKLTTRKTQDHGMI